MGVLYMANNRSIEENKLGLLKLHLWICFVCVFVLQMNDKEKNKSLILP